MQDLRLKQACTLEQGTCPQFLLLCLLSSPFVSFLLGFIVIFLSLLKHVRVTYLKILLGLMVHTCNPSTWEGEAGRPVVSDQPEPHSKC